MRRLLSLVMVVILTPLAARGAPVLIGPRTLRDSVEVIKASRMKSTRRMIATGAGGAGAFLLTVGGIVLSNKVKSSAAAFAIRRLAHAILPTAMATGGVGTAFTIAGLATFETFHIGSAHASELADGLVASPENLQRFLALPPERMLALAEHDPAVAELVVKLAAEALRVNEAR